MKERIPRPKDELACRKMMNHNAYRFESTDDLWHAMMVCYSGWCLWDGVQIVKNQFDMHRYFDLLYQEKFDVILETGLQSGGSAKFFMDTLDILDMTHVPYIGIDINMSSVHPSVLEHSHSHIWLQNDCLALETVASVAPFVLDRKSLIILDSVHTKEHVDEELRLYAPLSSAGSCLVVEDTDHSGFPVLADYGKSAHHSVEEFLKTDLGQKFDVDRKTEMRYGSFTANPGGWLKRK